MGWEGKVRSGRLSGNVGKGEEKGRGGSGSEGMGN
jgi:hypothetical protein